MSNLKEMRRKLNIGAKLSRVETLASGVLESLSRMEERKDRIDAQDKRMNQLEARIRKMESERD